MYKFEIYRNPNNPMVGSNYNDMIRYAEDIYTFERTITPKWNELAFKWEKDDGRFFFRKKLDGEFSITGSDYDWANDIRTDDSEKNIYRILKISEKTNGAWSIIWKGFFSIVDGTFDLHKCFAKFSDIPVFDEYSVIIENIDREVNLIDIPPVSINYRIHTYDYEVDVITTTSSFLACTATKPSFLHVLPSEEFPDETEKWTLFRKTTSYGGQAYVGGVYSWIYNITFEYRRDITYASGSPGADWVLIDPDPPGTSLDKYARHYKDMDALSFNYTEYAKTIYNEILGDYCLFYYSDNTVNLPDDLEYENDRARTLSSVIFKLLYDNTDLTWYTSTFFEGVTNPITGETNKLNYLMVLQISDMKTTSDAATRGMYSFKDLESWLSMFQCGWYIDESGYFRVEHRKYFDLGLSYDGNTSDMTIKNIPQVVKYSDDTPQTERLKFAYSNGQDFVGEPITYHGSIVNRAEGVGVREISINNLSTDLTYITSNQDEIGNDGFFICATAITNNDELWVLRRNGELSGELQENGDLSTANLMSEYWLWWRSAVSGIMNKQVTEFTEKNIVIHEDIIIASCDDFNPNKLKSTDIGDGKVEEATLTLKDKRLTLTLSY